METKHCVPKTREDDVTNSNGRDASPENGPSYRTWGRTGINGDGYAWAERNNWGGDNSGDGAVE